MDIPQQPLKITITPAPQAAKNATGFWQEDGPNFKDLLDTLNPLQHIPLVSNVYQSLTGDVPSTGAKIAGDTLFGGALGLLASIFNSIVETETGTDIGGNIVSTLTGTPTPGPAHIAASESASSEIQPRYVSASRQNSYNAYVSVQNA